MEFRLRKKKNKQIKEKTEGDRKKINACVADKLWEMFLKQNSWFFSHPIFDLNLQGEEYSAESSRSEKDVDS